MQLPKESNRVRGWGKDINDDADCKQIKSIWVQVSHWVHGSPMESIGVRGWVIDLDEPDCKEMSPLESSGIGVQEKKKFNNRGSLELVELEESEPYFSYTYHQ